MPLPMMALPWVSQKENCLPLKLERRHLRTPLRASPTPLQRLVASHFHLFTTACAHQRKGIRFAAHSSCCFASSELLRKPIYRQAARCDEPVLAGWTAACSSYTASYLDHIHLSASNQSCSTSFLGIVERFFTLHLAAPRPDFPNVVTRTGSAYFVGSVVT
jgi:hypothetical protein